MSWENQLVYVTKTGRRLDVLPKTRSVAYEVADAAEDAGHKITRIIGKTTWYQHVDGLCLDFVCDADTQKWIRDYLIRDRERLQPEYLINQHRMWRAYAKRNLRDNKGRGYGSYDPFTWSPYGPQDGPDAGSEPDPGRYIGTDNPHTDHVHLTLYAGDYEAPPKPAPPTPNPEPKGKAVKLSNLKPGKDNDDVVILQRALISHGQKIPAGATGYYGDQTKSAVQAFQRKQGWSGSQADGIPGPTTIARLGLTVKD